MAGTPDAAVKRQFSVNVDEPDYQALRRLAGARRTSVAQIIREYIASGLERDRRIERIAQAVEVA